MSNVPKQEMIYHALGWNAPEWVHIPMVLDSERRKLSKRSGAISIGEYRRRGWAPEAVISYLATLSWSVAPADRIVPLDELAGIFELNAVARFSPVHDEARMAHFGKMYVAGLPDEYLLDVCQEAFHSNGLPCAPEEEKITLIHELRPECVTCNELSSSVTRELSFRDEDGEKTLPEWFEDFSARMDEIGDNDWTSRNLTDVMKSFARERSLKGKDFFHPVRVFLTGASRGAPIGLILSCVGKRESQRRLKFVMDK
jgi:glutamyl/glutaminyl-tRNA synthetase